MSTITAWPGRAEMWLDARGKGAWIAATVLAFIAFWPLGLFLLAYLIWSKRMFSKSCGWDRDDAHSRMARCHSRRHGFRSSGNTAFDAYKADTLNRLEREQEEFEGFLKRLRESKDKAEFDQYLDERARAARDGESDDDATPGATPGNERRSPDRQEPGRY